MHFAGCSGLRSLVREKNQSFDAARELLHLAQLAA